MKHVAGDRKTHPYSVVPYIGTWIETAYIRDHKDVILVVPYIGTWIETMIARVAKAPALRRTLYRYVD